VQASVVTGIPYFGIDRSDRLHRHHTTANSAAKKRWHSLNAIPGGHIDDCCSEIRIASEGAAILDNVAQGHFEPSP
jgi:hypothetical protein